MGIEKWTPLKPSTMPRRDRTEQEYYGMVVNEWEEYLSRHKI